MARPWSRSLQTEDWRAISSSGSSALRSAARPGRHVEDDDEVRARQQAAQRLDEAGAHAEPVPARVDREVEEAPLHDHEPGAHLRRPDLEDVPEQGVRPEVEDERMRQQASVRLALVRLRGIGGRPSGDGARAREDAGTKVDQLGAPEQLTALAGQLFGNGRLARAVRPHDRHDEAGRVQDAADDPHDLPQARLSIRLGERARRLNMSLRQWATVSSHGMTPLAM